MFQRRSARSKLKDEQTINHRRRAVTNATECPKLWYYRDEEMAIGDGSRETAIGNSARLHNALRHTLDFVRTRTARQRSKDLLSMNDAVHRDSKELVTRHFSNIHEYNPIPSIGIYEFSSSVSSRCLPSGRNYHPVVISNRMDSRIVDVERNTDETSYDRLYKKEDRRGPFTRVATMRFNTKRDYSERIIYSFERISIANALGRLIYLTSSM